MTTTLAPMNTTSFYANLPTQQQLPTHIADPFDLNESLQVGVASAVFFIYLNIIIRRRFNDKDNKSHNEEFCARVVSWVHAVISTIGGAYALYEHTGIDFHAPATRLQANWQMVTLAYFIVDTLQMIFVSEFDITFFLHHCLSVASLALGSLFGINGVIVCAAQVAGEISNPLMHGRWLLNAAGYKDSFFCKATTRLWFVTFSVSRCVVSPWLFVRIVSEEIMHPVYYPQVAAMIIFSTIFLINATRKEMKGEWWTG